MIAQYIKVLDRRTQQSFNPIMDDSELESLVAEIRRDMNMTRRCDRISLKRRFDRLKKTSKHQELLRLLADLRASANEKQRRVDDAPRPKYPEELPISDRREEIIDAIRKNQVIILSGETGSGKTTQIPKMCIEAGRGVDGLIGCTQPRRIAALTVASRIAEELGDESIVGSKIRFHDSSRPENFVRIMTDGILLAEAQGHPRLGAYDTLIIDEAHERSINIDVLLGMLRRLVEKRTDLKLIITSATLDTEKFSRHFRDAPIIEVSGRTYPVEIRYQTDDSDAGLSLSERATAAIADILDESRRGDILVFQPTEQDIKDTIELSSRNWGDRLNILPLYARLPASEQKKAFIPGGKRKLVVATNVAETSLTIPGIRYVVDTGLARISRYNPGTGTQGLPVDPISRASADQRAGRCGRVEDGICLRLYSEEDYTGRTQYTQPEIRRTNLAEVILRLIDIGITDIENFPFVDPPPSAGIRDGLRTLNEVGALVSSTDRRLSTDGRLMAKLPLDPRLARMLIQADRESCLGDVLPVAAALSLQDPREKPPEKAGSAEAAHQTFRDENSDFIGWLNIWDGFRKGGGKGSYSGKLKRYCKVNFLSFRRMREWMDVHRQLALVMEENGYRLHRTADDPWIDKKGAFTNRYAAIHRSILAGLLSHIARREEAGNYEATRNRKIYIHPGSALKKSTAPWIVASEIVRTSRLFARSAAAIDPLWLEDVGSHLVKKTWINPRWDRKRGTVMAEEQGRLFGFLVSDDRIVPFGPHRPSEARDVFIRKALLEQEIGDIGAYPFLKSNRRLIKRLRDMESKLRRKDLVAGDEGVYAFYSDRLPPGVIDIGTLNIALKKDRRLKDRLFMVDEDLLTGIDVHDELRDFPDSADIAGEKWKLSYVFDAESKRDGVTLRIPAGRLSEMKIGESDWAVPGLLREKVEALMRGLPKSFRRKLIPIPETAEEAVSNMKKEGDLVHALSAWLYREKRVDIPPREWKVDNLPDYLRMRYALLDDAGREIASGFDPSRLRSAGTTEAERKAKSAMVGPSRQYRKDNERHNLVEWPGDLPRSVKIPGGATLWPALEDNGEAVNLRFYNDRSEAEEAHESGQARLAHLYWKREIRDFQRQKPLSGEARVCANYIGGAVKVETEVWNRVIRDLFGKPLVRTGNEWKALLQAGGKQLHELSEKYLAMVSKILVAYCEVRKRLSEMARKSHRKRFLETCIEETENMLSLDFIQNESLEYWTALPRWLKAVEARGRKGAEDPGRDQRFLDAWSPLNARLSGIIENLSPLASEEKRQSVQQARMMIEELRVALSAVGEVRPVGKISESRMTKFLDEIERML